MKKHKQHILHYEMIGEPADAFWFSHEIIKDIGRVYNINPLRNPFLRTEMMLERKTHHFATQSGMREMLHFGGKRKLHDGLIDLRLKKLKARIRRR